MLTAGTHWVYRDPTGFNWHLAGPMAGREGVTLMPGPKGLWGAPKDLIFTEGARQEGATYTGESVHRRVVDFEVDVHADTPHQFRRLNEQWLRAHQTREFGHLLTWAPMGNWMALRVRKGEVPVPKWPKDSSLICSQQYMMQWIAEKAYFEGPDETSLWQDKGGASTGKLCLRNPGHLPGWPRYIITGPGQPFIQDGPGGPMIDLPKLDPGEIWRVDTYERKPTIVSSKRTNPWAYMRGRRFRRSIPPGRSVELNVSMRGGDRTNQILAVLTPRYDWFS
ncbi:Bacteriophage protein [Mycobacteroides abscessus subsp. abscessus]|nr:Bacteriophage protein [Mycobacteroides abscessus subsp. abscessus]